MGWYIAVIIAIILLGVWVRDAERNYVSRSQQDPTDEDVIERLTARLRDDT